MFKNITWSAYFTFIITALVVYYVIICFKYYKAEIKNIFSGTYNPFQRRLSIKLTSNKNSAQTRLSDEQSTGQDLFPLINQFADEIKNLLEQAAKNNLIKQEMIYSLQQLAKKYFQVKASSFQSFITNYILVESSNYSSIHLSEEDVNMMWVM